MGPGACVSIIQVWMKLVQNMSTPTSYLSDRGFHGVLWTLVISRCVFRLSSNQPHHWWWKENIVHHAIQNFLLHQDAIRAEEWGEGGTYQKCIHIILENQLGRNFEAYIDDIVVKSKKHGDLLDDLKKTFDNLHKYKTMLNPKKCVFGVSLGKLLGYMVSSWGIDANPTKVEAIKKLQPPMIRKEI
jgi:hypothetical protein